MNSNGSFGAEDRSMWLPYDLLYLHLILPGSIFDETEQVEVKWKDYSNRHNSFEHSSKLTVELGESLSAYPKNGPIRGKLTVKTNFRYMHLMLDADVQCSFKIHSNTC